MKGQIIIYPRNLASAPLVIHVNVSGQKFEPQTALSAYGHPLKVGHVWSRGCFPGNLGPLDCECTVEV